MVERRRPVGCDADGSGGGRGSGKPAHRQLQQNAGMTTWMSGVRWRALLQESAWHARLLGAGLVLAGGLGLYLLVRSAEAAPDRRPDVLVCVLFLLIMLQGIHAVWLLRREARSRREAAAAREQAAAAAALAAEAVRDKGKFLGMLSHELLTPLQSIVSSMELIESRGMVHATDPVFMRLGEGAGALRARMSDLIDFARMTAGRLEMSPRKFRVDRLVEEVIADHEEAVIRKELDIHWEPGEDITRPVVTDPRRVRQILHNLVSNAIKYTARGGVTVEATLDDGGQRLRLEVRDTGIGMAPDQLELVFDPFYRVASSARMADGSGLGLAVVRSLVDLLRGRLQVESRLGEGTRVTVELPVGTPAGTAVPAPVVPGGAGPVLIVDDAPEARAAVADIVRSLGCQPFEAGSGSEALRALSERRYLAVLLDIDLPDFSGMEVARQVRAGQGPNRQGCLVMLSAAQHGEAAPGLFDLCVDKPVDRGQLHRLLQQAAARQGEHRV